MSRLFLLLILLSLPTHASDHADTPFYNMSRDDLKITGLLSFVDGDNFILILGTNPNLSSDVSTYQFPTDVHFNFYIDYDTDVNFDNPINNALYGGSISKPQTIKEDISISLVFDKKSSALAANTFSVNIVSSQNIVQADLKIEALVRDDPFTFPSFHGKNIAAIVVSIPLEKLDVPSEQPLLLWANITTVNSAQDTVIWEQVGRALRSQIPGQWEFNRYHPAKQQAYIGTTSDVMIYNRLKPALLPNGRSPNDDTLSILCTAGDIAVCDLLNKAKTGNYNPPYNGMNDKTFLSTFPYLPAPH